MSFALASSNAAAIASAAFFASRYAAAALSHSASSRTRMSRAVSGGGCASLTHRMKSSRAVVNLWPEIRLRRDLEQQAVCAVKDVDVRYVGARNMELVLHL